MEENNEEINIEIENQYLKEQVKDLIQIIDLMALDLLNISKGNYNINEKEYLSNLIKPFKNKVKIIEKTEENELQYLNIYVENDGYITLPGFEANTMYKGMKSDKEYTLKELGLD